MSESIEKCFLIDIKDYDIFDHIITILNNRNELISLYSKGTKKILSKNYRNFIYGSILEIEYFKARKKDSLSKLKKIKLISKLLDNVLQQQFPFIVLNWYISKKNLKYFNFRKYEKIISTLNNYDEETSLIYILHTIIIDSGNAIEINKCSICSNKKIKTTSVTWKGYLCNECSIKKNEYIHSTEFNKIFIHLHNDDLDTIKNFNEKKELINFLKSYIYHNCGINIYDILELK